MRERERERECKRKEKKKKERKKRRKEIIITNYWRYRTHSASFTVRWALGMWRNKKRKRKERKNVDLGHSKSPWKSLCFSQVLDFYHSFLHSSFTKVSECRAREGGREEERVSERSRREPEVVRGTTVHEKKRKEKNHPLVARASILSNFFFFFCFVVVRTISK